jgi:hypothetical protein
VTTLETGNAALAGAPPRGWLVGDLATWAMERGDSLDAGSTPRQSDQVQVKWYVHPPGHVRPRWAERDEHWTLGVLVAGAMRFEFREPGGRARVIELTEQGDYVLWHGPSWEHRWATDAGCTILTVRWPAEEGR